MVCALGAISGCLPNCPYREADREKNIYYSSFAEPPKHMDPATAYSSDEYQFLCQVYEPPLQYHFLKRPYTLIPLTAVDLPQPRPRRVNGSDGKSHEYITLDVHIRPGIRYAPHPCFGGSAKEL